MAGGDFYQGEIKKKKKGQSGKPISQSPIFTLPTVAPKGKNKY